MYIEINGKFRRFLRVRLWLFFGQRGKPKRAPVHPDLSFDREGVSFAAMKRYRGFYARHRL